jgi:hypothetical protein
LSWINHLFAQASQGPPGGADAKRQIDIEAGRNGRSRQGALSRSALGDAAGRFAGPGRLRSREGRPRPAVDGGDRALAADPVPGRLPRAAPLFRGGRPVMPPLQYGSEEAEKTSVLAFCQGSDRVLQFVLGDTLGAGARRLGISVILAILVAIAASVAGPSPR